MKKINSLIVSIIMLLSINFVLAISTTPNHIVFDENNKDNALRVTFSGLNGSLNLFLSGSISSYLSMSHNSVNEFGDYVDISLIDDIPNNLLVGSINFDGGSIPITILVDEEESNPGDCQIRPSIGEYNQDYQQGAQVTETITFDPQDCDGDIIISGVSVQGGVVDSNGKRKPVSKGMITSDEINVNIDTEGLPSKTYDGIKLTFNAYGTQHTIRFKIGVTGNAGGSGTFDINNLPTCSLTNNILLLNSTYSLICTNIANDLTINPLIDNDYIIGTNLERSDTQFIWYFQPKKQGNTFIKAGFKYLGVPVGDDYSQEVKIQSTGYSIEGTDLDFKFTPDLNSATIGEEVLIQIVDNKTQSLVQNPRLWINAIEINGTETFKFLFEPETEYEFRASVPGYNDLIQTFKISPRQIIIIINPTSGDVNTQFNLTTDIENSTIKINNVSYPNPYLGTLPTGINLIEVIKTGYDSTYLNVTVSDYIRATKENMADFKKGAEQNYTLSGNVSVWIVYHQKDLDSPLEEYIRGTGNLVSFTPKKSGIYTIMADNTNVQNGKMEIKGFSFKKKWWFMPIWGWLIGVVVLVVIVIFVIIKIKGGGGSSPGFSSAPINYE